MTMDWESADLTLCARTSLDIAKLLLKPPKGSRQLNRVERAIQDEEQLSLATRIMPYIVAHDCAVRAEGAPGEGAPVGGDPPLPRVPPAREAVRVTPTSEKPRSDGSKTGLSPLDRTSKAITQWNQLRKT